MRDKTISTRAQRDRRPRAWHGMAPFLVPGIPNAVDHFMLHITLTKERAALEMCHGNIGHFTLPFMRSFVQGPQPTPSLQ